MSRVPFLNDHPYLSLIPVGIIILLLWSSASTRHAYIHVSDDNEPTCLSCTNYISSTGECIHNNRTVINPSFHTCDKHSDYDFFWKTIDLIHTMFMRSPLPLRIVSLVLFVIVTLLNVAYLLDHTLFIVLFDGFRYFLTAMTLFLPNLKGILQADEFSNPVIRILLAFVACFTISIAISAGVYILIFLLGVAIILIDLAFKIIKWIIGLFR